MHAGRRSESAPAVHFLGVKLNCGRRGLPLTSKGKSESMPFTPASTGSVVAFVAIVGFVVAAFVCAVHRAYRGDPLAARRMTLLGAGGFIFYLAVVSALVASGRLAALPLYGLPFFFGSIFVVSIVFGLSRMGGRIAAEVPVPALVGFQAFRLPLELVLHQWALGGTIPETMTWTGQNWDIISGIVALACAPFARRRAIAWFANLVGSLLLLNVIRVAILSAPLPFAWDVKPPLLVALHLPYAWIGPVCVGGALAGHLILTRALLRR